MKNQILITRKIKKLSLIFVLIISIASCSKNDDNSSGQDNNNCTQNSSLENTIWLGNGDRNGETITFSSNGEYSWNADWGNRSGLYCFDGTNGNFDETIRFTISENVITLNPEDQGGTGVFIKQ